MQASAIAKMEAEVTQHNKLLLQLAQSFPASHSGASVHTYDFGAAFSQASFLDAVSPSVRTQDRPFLSCTFSHLLPAAYTNKQKLHDYIGMVLHHHSKPWSNEISHCANRPAVGDSWHAIDAGCPSKP